MSEQPKKDSQVTYVSPSRQGQLTVVVKNAIKNIKQTGQVQICKYPPGTQGPIYMDKVIITADNKLFTTNDEFLIKAIDEKIADLREQGWGFNRIPFFRLDDMKLMKAEQPEQVPIGEGENRKFYSIKEIKEALAQKEESERTLANQEIVSGTKGTTGVQTNKKGKK